ncbi:MAG: UvrB/UvrC motif-containing protein [Thermoguttaceae bacterium]|nr:UvrB/UvrC motif-containing protein [Thermoguttaceae bacterium]
MKCQKCDKTATFHITEMINARPEELHLCDEHAYQYLHGNDASLGNVEGSFDDGLGLKDFTEELEASDDEFCPCCERSFLDFRKSRKLGCENDYRVFRDRLEPLLFNIHGASEHVGKRPSRFAPNDFGAKLVRLRAELADAVSIEDYERASKLRDEIKELSEKTK